MSITLAIAMTDVSTMILTNGQITNASGPGVLTIESEQMSYTGNDVNQFYGVVRGYNSTTAVAHAEGIAISYVTNEPVGIGDLNGTAPVTVSGGTGILVGGSATVSLAASTDSVNGYMTSADHTKLSTLFSNNTGTNTGDETQSTIKTKLAELPFDLLASDPMSPAEGQFWYNTTSHLLKFYDGSTVQTVAHV